MPAAAGIRRRGSWVQTIASVPRYGGTEVNAVALVSVAASSHQVAALHFIKANHDPEEEPARKGKGVASLGRNSNGARGPKLQEPLRAIARLADNDKWRSQVREAHVMKDSVALEKMADEDTRLVVANCRGMPNRAATAVCQDTVLTLSVWHSVFSRRMPWRSR